MLDTRLQRVFIAHILTVLVMKEESVKRRGRGGNSSVGSRDILKPLSHVPLDPDVPQTAIFCPDVPLLSKTGCWCKVETRCLSLSVPESLFGLKLPLSSFNLPHRGLDLEETSSLPLTYSDVTLMSAP